MRRSISIRTSKRCDFIDVTDKAAAFVVESRVKGGVLTIFCPHTTAGVTINENADPDVVKDLIMKSAKLIEPNDPDYRHSEGNSDGHLKSSLFGPSLTVIIEDGRMLLGTWQAIYFAEFDGPRERTLHLKIIEG